MKPCVCSSRGVSDRHLTHSQDGEALMGGRGFVQPLTLGGGCLWTHLLRKWWHVCWRQVPHGAILGTVQPKC